jgi:hypothetical protein
VQDLGNLEELAKELVSALAAVTLVMAVVMENLVKTWVTVVVVKEDAMEEEVEGAAVDMVGVEAVTLTIVIKTIAMEVAVTEAEDLQTTLMEIILVVIATTKIKIRMMINLKIVTTTLRKGNQILALNKTKQIMTKR